MSNGPTSGAPVALVVLDGWGYRTEREGNAIELGNTPVWHGLWNSSPRTLLDASGLAVGLPEGQMGNSEVGHLNLGAGRVVYQELQRINVAIRDGSFSQNPVLLQSIRFAKENNKPLHLLGLVSHGGVHSHINHLKAIIDVRDCDPKSGSDFILQLQQHLNDTVGKIASVSGRYFAMDRDKRWERIKLAYDALVKGEGAKATDALAAVENSYAQNITD